MRKLLFVCTANLCRSPMAEALARALGVEAASAGVNAETGLHMHPLAATTLARRGIPDIDQFRSRLITNADLAQADIVLCMERLHRQAILRIEPAAVTKTFTLVELAHIITTFPEVSDLSAAHSKRRFVEDGDIADPVSGTKADFDHCCEQLAALIGSITRGLQ